MRIRFFFLFTLVLIVILSSCETTHSNTTEKTSLSSTVESKIEVVEEKHYLTGSEYERINDMFEGYWQGYAGDNLTEYVFADGEFEVYVEIGGQILSNYGTYKLTNVDMELYFQNGTRKTIQYTVSGNEVLWDLPQ